MDRLLAQWYACGDNRSGFLSCYRLMTGNMVEAIGEGHFQDPIWVGGLLERFAGYYFDAQRAFDAGLATTPAVWQHAHQVTLDAPLHVLQRLLLGINAHINYDLVLTLVDVLREHWRDADQQTRAIWYADHCAVNGVIGRTIDRVQDEVIEPGSRSMVWLDHLLGPVDEWLLSRLITTWREEVWCQAVALLEAEEGPRQERILRRIEETTLRRAEKLLLP